MRIAILERMASSGGSAGVVPILIGATVFGAGLFAYIYHSIPGREELLARPSGPDPQTSAAFAAAEALDVTVKAVAAEFIARVREERYADAHALMATPYRAAVKPSDFAEACKKSSFLASVQSISIYRVRETVPPGGSIGAGAITGTGVLTSNAGAVPVTLTFLAEGDRLHVLSLVIAGVPVLAPR